MAHIALRARPGTLERLAARSASRRANLSSMQSILLLADMVVMMLVGGLVIQLRSRLTIFGPGRDVVDLVLPVLGLVIALWLLNFVAVGAYRSRLIGAGTAEYRTVLQGSLLTAAGVGISAYLFNYPLSRGFFFLAFGMGTPALLASRFTLRRVLHKLRRRGHFRREVILAGHPWRIDQIAETLRREEWLGYDPIGALVHPDDALPTSVPLLGTPDDIVGAVRQSNASAVIFLEGSFRRQHHFNELAREMEKERAQLIVVPALAEISSNRIDVQTVAGLPLVTVAKPQAERAGRGLKRTFDIVLASLILLMVSPVILVAALLIKLEDHGPIVYRQPRVGHRGQIFECLKLRSMVTNADEIRQQLLDHHDGAGVLFKLKRDPRVTRVGRVIRRYSIDELPQLWNVLRGDMSLVGPRPALPLEVDQYQRYVTRRLDVRPGITGLWQVSGRSDLSWDDSVRLDLYYVDNWSFTQDLGILFRTAKAVLDARGAY